MLKFLRFFRILLFSIPLLFLAGFFFYPLVRIFQVSFRATGGQELDAFINLVQGRYFWQLIWFTSWQAAASTALTLVIGLPFAYLFAHYAFPGKTLLHAMTTIPFVMPTVVVAAAITALIGRQGIINQWLQTLFQTNTPPIDLLQTIWIILIAHAFYNVSVVIRTVGGFWGALNPRLRQAAAVLGASPPRVFWEITLPLLLPSIIAASLLIFLFCFTSFGVVLILGGLQFATLEVEIYRQAVSLFNLPVAAFLSLVQMALTFAVMALYTRLQARLSIPLELQPATVVARPPRRHQWYFVGAAVLFLLLVLLGPLLALVWRSFTLGGNGWTLAYYQELTLNRRQSAFFVPPVIAVRNSLFFASATTALSLFLGVVSAYLLARPRGWLSTILDPLFLLPLGVSAVTLGFGYIVAMGPLRTSLILVPIAHTLIAAPFVLRSFLPALRSLDPQLHSAAAVLGAGPIRSWWEVDAPILLRALLVSAIFAFTVSLGEFGATLLISRPDTPTMPVVIFQALSRPGLLNYGQALAMSTILMAVCTVAVLLIERFRLPGTSEF
ncbi:MAG TPA: iron ABC transporter permease [Caldilineaceae bacterium]|nr:iron ABC transporter permease [Caldilineaceae bacterium]